MTEKLQIAIYKIETDSLDEMIAKCVAKNFTEQSLSVTSQDGFTFKLYYQSKPSRPKWKDFTKTIVNDSEEITKSNKSRMEGFILLISKGKNLYAVTGGHGHFVVQDSIDNNFGIDVFSRLIKKEDKILKSTREKSLVGGVLGSVYI